MSSPLREVIETVLVALYNATVGTLVHELGHYVVAKAYGLEPELHSYYVIRNPGHDFAVGIAGGLAEALSMVPVRMMVKSELAKTLTDALIAGSVAYAVFEGVKMYKYGTLAYVMLTPFLIKETLEAVKRWSEW